MKVGFPEDWFGSCSPKGNTSYMCHEAGYQNAKGDMKRVNCRDIVLVPSLEVTSKQIQPLMAQLQQAGVHVKVQCAVRTQECV